MNNFDIVSNSTGLAPETVLYIGNKTDHPLEIEVFDYSELENKRSVFDTITDFLKSTNALKNRWVNINGLNKASVFEKIGSTFNFHPLILEDIVNTEQRAKLDEFDDHLFLVFKMLHYNTEGELCFEHISFILGKDFLFSFQESDNDVFEAIRSRLKNNKGRIRNFGVDYLLYLLLDAIIDNYFHLIEDLGSKIEGMEDGVFAKKQEEDIAQDIQALKREILRIRRTIFPIREVIKRVVKTQSNLFTSKTQFYINDLLDHIIQVSENLEIYREMVAGLMDMYMTTINNRMNEVMKVLTIIATIFIPLTFIVGVYGMNFEYMPELKFKYSYHILITTIVLIFVGFLFYFKRKNGYKIRLASIHRFI